MSRRTKTAKPQKPVGRVSFSMLNVTLDGETIVNEVSVDTEIRAGESILGAIGRAMVEQSKLRRTESLPEKKRAR